MKPATTLDEQVRLLEARGLGIVDHDETKSFLLNSNYYRISGYCRQFQVDPASNNNSFIMGTRFAQVQGAYLYDVELSTILLEDLCVIERSLRARFAHYLSKTHGELAFYLDSDSYHDVTPELDAFLDKLHRELSRSRARMVKRYAVGNDYSAVPIWVAIELFSFGSVSKMIQYLKDDRAAKELAASYSLMWATFRNTVHSLAVLRNICAHHGQIWHRNLDNQTPIFKKEKRREPKFSTQGPYPAILAIKRFLNAIDPQSAELARLEAFFGAPSPFHEGVYDPKQA